MQASTPQRPLIRRLTTVLMAAGLAAGLAAPGTNARPGGDRSPLPLRPERATAEDGRSLHAVPALPQGASTDWWSQVQEGIRRSEYRVTWQENTVLPQGKPAYQAPNRGQNLRTYFTAEGVRWVPRTVEAPPWLVGLRLAKVGLAPAGEAEPEASGDRVAYRRAGVTEWYVNDERGLEQGFTLSQRPAKAKPEEPMRLSLSVLGNTTPRLSGDGGAVEFLAPGGALAIRYAELTAVDARGRKLDSRMELSGCTGGGSCAVHLVVEDAEAAYPVTIDPLATSPSWTAESDQAGARFGSSVGTAGDVNGDGYADVVVGAPYFDNGETEEGRAYVFHRSASGLSTTPGWTAESDQINWKFGYSVGTAGDVNGDGYADVIVGTTYGRAYVYHGSTSGLLTAPSWAGQSDQANALFGIPVRTAGDVNADGYDDVIVGAYGYDNGQVDEGRAYVFHGSASGLPTGPNWTAESNQASALFGSSVGSAGDVNGDGFADVIVGAARYDNGQTDEGRAYVYHGSAFGLQATPSWTAEGDQTNASFGASAGAAGDVNGDGYADVVVGDGFSNGEVAEGRANVYHGSASGLQATPSWTAEGNQEGALFGSSVGTAGDVNGDGYADLIVGAYRYDQGATDNGRAYVYFGSASGVSAAPVWTAAGQVSNEMLGSSVATAGDVNGDGYADVLIGAPRAGHGQAEEGRAYAYHGSPSGLMASPSWAADGNQAGGEFGASVGTAGDVNADGYADVIVGAHSFDNGQVNEGRALVYHGSPSGLSTTPNWAVEPDQVAVRFGWSVGTAGDVNGDGYADVIVGTYYGDRSYAYHGSASGLSPTASWSGEQAGMSFGRSVGTAGDVNGDGYADVVVGAPLADGGETDEGRAYVYQGSSSGLLATPSWTAESNQAGAQLGFSVKTAGDVNGDGYADVIVGAPFYDNGEPDEGRTYVYHGSVWGLLATPSWTAEGEQVGATRGSSVGTAGDVNGDGYADVIVGAVNYDNGEADEGCASVYHGSAVGLEASPSWTSEGGQDSAYFGHSVGTAGDVNGDGYADVVVGAAGYQNGQTDEGRAYVFHGSAVGILATPSWTAESDQGGAWFGTSVGTAGDLNGDGYADVIVGAHQFDSGETDEGRAFVFYGNSAGRAVRARQLRGDGSTLVQPWGASWDRDGFQVRLTNTSPLGRQRVKLQLEACPNGRAFGDAICARATSPDWIDVTASGSGVALTQAMAGLISDRLYRWRARTLYASYTATQPGITVPPKPAHGPWRRLLGQALEADLRVLDPDLIFADGFEGEAIASGDGGAGDDGWDR